MTPVPEITLYLASASPRRHEILNQLLIKHHVLRVPLQPGDDEPQLDGEPPHDYVRRTAREKVTHASHWLAQRNTANATEDPRRFITQVHSEKLLTDVVVLSADTVVILDDVVLGKPVDRDDVGRTLSRLSGRTHQVHTALAVQRAGRLFEAVSVSEVTFKSLSASEIDAYCDTRDGMGKAGGYGIQGPAAAFVTRLSGSYTGVMGLPAYETVELLKAAHASPQ